MIIEHDAPLWVLYAEMITTGTSGTRHDKYYEVSIGLADDGRFLVTKRWGARPDMGRGQRTVVAYHALEAAERYARDVMAHKIAKGYRAAERPWSAPEAWV
jgi:predicted DNA-binding WGR domain protein